MEQIVDRKRSSTEGRADSLNAYAHILMARYAKDDIESRTGELLPSILRSIKSDTSERETISALRGRSPSSNTSMHAARLTPPQLSPSPPLRLTQTTYTTLPPIYFAVSFQVLSRYIRRSVPSMRWVRQPSLAEPLKRSSKTLCLFSSKL